MDITNPTTTPRKRPAIAQFRRILRNALLLSHAELRLFDQIPEALLQGIFQTNFNGNLNLAERLLLNRYGGVDSTDRPRLESEKRKIANLDKASRLLANEMIARRNVLFITDNDNDGSLAQAALLEFNKALPPALRPYLHVEYAQPIGQSRGLTFEVTDLAVKARGWASHDTFTIITADNGINNRSEVERITRAYPNAKVIITDHHLPSDDTVVEESERVMIVNPKYKPTTYFKNNNISGANVAGLVAGGALKEIVAADRGESVNNVRLTAEQQLALTNMEEIGVWANLLDYADSDIADMPTRPYVINKALELRPLLNVSNSMANLITGRFDDTVINDLVAAANHPDISHEWVRDRVEDVQSLNHFAHKLLSLYHRVTGNLSLPQAETAYSDFYRELAIEIDRTDLSYESINPNYIEQLRPHIFNLAAIDNKDVFMATMADCMKGVFENLRQQERTITERLRQTELLKQDRLSHSSMMYPVHPAVVKVFNRKLLNKAYNQANNGFAVIFDTDGAIVSGSMRSLYPASRIFADKALIEQQMGVTIDIQGHECAAGFKVTSTAGATITDAQLKTLNQWINASVSTLAANDAQNQLPTLEIDFAAVGLLAKLNGLVKAHLAGMQGIPALLRFTPEREEGVTGTKIGHAYVTDPDTAEQISLADVVQRKRYGYQKIATDFHGGAILVPVEMLRAVVDSGYTKALGLSFMNEGVFMASKVVDPDQIPKANRSFLHGGRSDQNKLAEYYQDTFKNTHFIPLSREDFLSSPYFRYNQFGQREFERWEQMTIQFLDTLDRDVLAVIDTEGTGLGKAPKCFNIGGTNIKIDENSGQTLPMEEFAERFFRTNDGQTFLLTAEQVASLLPMDPDEVLADPTLSVVLRRATLDSSSSDVSRHVFTGSTQDLKPITNFKSNPDGTVLFNRRVNGFAWSFLVKGKDFHITQEFENLTGVANWMIQALGREAVTVDKRLTDFYSNLTGAGGRPAKVVFQAHNMPYDRGVITSNFNRFSALMDEHLTSDTAKIARQDKLAYDDTPVSSFDGVAGIPAKTYFYDSPASDYSLSTFLQRARRGKGGVFTDITSTYLLRYNPQNERFSWIDRKKNREVLLDTDMESLEKSKAHGPLPNNAVKFSVERLSLRAMIRNILLHDLPPARHVTLLPNEAPFRDVLTYFQDNYHYDSTPERNIENFKNHLAATGRDMSMFDRFNIEDLCLRFLQTNKALQARFHDGWLYEKVLLAHEPKPGRLSKAQVEQIGYYTDLPSKRIRRILGHVNAYRKAFGINDVLVHEMHNNIRQRSDDGQGLSDTAYEIVLPQLLAMAKAANPFDVTAGSAIYRLIETNVKGSLIQGLVADENDDGVARDTYSATQMMSFNRWGTTDKIKAAQKLVNSGKTGSGRNEPLAPIKFKLSTGILPPGSAIYAVPKRHLSQEEVRQASAALEAIMINEQLKTAAKKSKTVGADEEIIVLGIAHARDRDMIKQRDQLLDLFERVDFERRDGTIKKVSDLLRKAADGGVAKLPRQGTFSVTDPVLKAAVGLANDYRRVYERLGQPVNHGNIDKLMVQLTERHTQDVQALTDQARAQTDGMDGEVRCHKFLPLVDIERREPLKFLIKHAGLSPFFAFLRDQIKARQETIKANEATVTCDLLAPAGTQGKPRRRP